MTDNADIASIQDAVRKKYAEVSISAAGKLNYPTGREGAILLEYDPEIIGGLPDALIESFCGVGNPFSLGPINPGETVLDVGCGAGFDLIVASRFIGQRGRAYGIDITPEMVEKARRNVIGSGASNVQVQIAGAEEIPFEDASFDVIISNGVLNLSPLKERCFREISRVLKPKGRLQFADIVLKGDRSGGRAGTLEAWAS